MDVRLDMLLNPPFAKDPPVKLNVDAKTLGAVYALLGAIAALFGLVGILGLSGISAYASLFGVRTVILLVLVGNIVSLVGTLMCAWGGYRMYQLDRAGKRTVIYGLAVVALGGLVSALGTYGGGLANWIVSLAVLFVLYYLVIISRFEGEAKLV